MVEAKVDINANRLKNDDINYEEVVKNEQEQIWNFRATSIKNYQDKNKFKDGS